MLILMLAAAVSDTDYPHRPWGQVATLSMSASEATACIARELDKGGSALVLPVEGGTDIDWSVDVSWGKRPDAWERFSVRSGGGSTTMTVSYRHPSSVKRVAKHVDKLAKACLRIAEMRPA
jgi:hypothetical protein